MNSKALYIVKTLVDNGYQAVFAGGFVRDMLICEKSNDIDIATSAKPEEVERFFQKTLPIGKSFGVILVIIDDEKFEVATFRSDGVYTDGRHPESVIFSTLEEDARRRDITINGMFYDPLEDKIIDVVGGQTDLKQKIVRLIGNSVDRIKEDKLRLMRIIRFASRFGFEIEPKTYLTIKEHAFELVTVSAERIADELTKILRLKNKRRAIELLFDTELMKFVLPEVFAMKDVEQPPEFHPEGSVLQHTLLSLELLKENASDELLWGTFLHDVGKPPTQTFEDRIRFSGHDLKGKYMAKEILKRLKFSNEFVDHVCSMIENHMKFSSVEKMRISKLKRFLNLSKFDEHLELHRVDCLSSHGGLEYYNFVLEKLKEFSSEHEQTRIDKMKRIVTGHDLITLGYKQGPVFRDILIDVEDQQLEGKLLNKEEAVDYIKSTYKL
ncbi:MAG: CCA tRNA nucleotidyltransferase [Candidatus Nanoarchaeia archaeon]|nr:CCA tRNA nucleotidyltransferase [Candidatus Nanoarchaeia archaeon]